MKKILASLIVLALVAPVMADVAVTATESSPGVLEITVTPSGDPAPVIRGVALLLGLDAANTGDGQATDASIDDSLNTNIDYYVTNPIVDADEDNVPDDPGHPAADPAGPGVATLPSADLSLCSGYLDSTGAQGGLTGPAVFTVNYSGTSDTLVSIALDTLRGSIVGDDIGDVTVQETQLVTFGGDPCRDKVLAVDGATAAALYDRYVAEGEDPSSWCWQYQCRGDADGLEETVFISGTFRTYQADLNLLIISWKLTPESEPAAADPRADINHAEESVFISGTYSVYQQDLNELITNWQKTTAWLDTTYGDGSAGSGACPTYLP
jgi:hypothetical protein